jgi:polar amino acid transport system permease protein
MSNVETIKVVPARYPLRAVGAAVALFVLAVVIQSVAFNPRWEWAVFARWFFDPVILEGVGQTLLLTLIGTALSVVFGGMLALARLSSSWLLSSLAWAYIWLFRSLPLIVVLIILYNFPISTTRSRSACRLPASPGAALKPSTCWGSSLPPWWG